MKKRPLCGRRLGALVGMGAAAALTLSLSSIMATPAHADTTQPSDKYKAMVAENYWADLTWYTDASGMHRYVPTPLVDYFKTSRLAWSDDLKHEFYTPGYPDLGIAAGDKADANITDFVTNFMGGYSLDLPHKEPSDPALNHWQGGKQWNPYGFNYKTDVLTTDPKTDYNIRGDIQEHGESSTDVVKHKVNDLVDLDLTIDMDMFKKMRNTQLLAIINSEFPAYYTMLNNLPENGVARSDGELVFVFDLPKGLEVTKSTTYTIKGIDDVELTATQENNDRRLIVKARLQPHGTDGVEPLKNLYARIQNLKTVTLSVNDLRVTSTVARDQDSTVVAHAYGAHEYVSSSSNDAIINKDYASVQNDDLHWYARLPLVFAAKQNDAGRDVTTPADKPNLMTYTFRVDAPAVNTVTFVSDGKNYASTKVEQDDTIDSDSLTTESMPANPTKDGYTFKAWNTKQDGTGDSFDGSTVVTGDMTVYAIYEKVPVAPQNDTPKQPTSTTKVKPTGALPKTGDSTSSQLTLASGLVAGILLTGIALRRRVN